MNPTVIGACIKKMRKKNQLTQTQLAEQIGVSSKAISKWETAKGLPDVSLLKPLAGVLGISVEELMAGEAAMNQNRSCHMLRSRFYVCPLCNNIIHAAGEAHISCCGITLSPLEARKADEAHTPTVETVEDEQYITLGHPMTKEHYISFLAYVTADRVQLVKLYPEGDAQTRLQLRGKGVLYCYCSRHGLMEYKP